MNSNQNIFRFSFVEKYFEIFWSLPPAFVCANRRKISWNYFTIKMLHWKVNMKVISNFLISQSINFEQHFPLLLLHRSPIGKCSKRSRKKSSQTKIKILLCCMSVDRAFRKDNPLLLLLLIDTKSFLSSSNYHHLSC